MDFIDLNSGTSVGGDEIKAYYSQNNKKEGKYLYLMAGAHGDEVEGVYVLDQLFNWLKDEDDLDLSIVVVPILNVDGYRAGTRTNANGVDLNRNYPCQSWSPDFTEDRYHPGPSALSEPENKFLDKLFQKFPPKMIISFHSWKPMINYDGEAKEAAEYLAQFNKYDVTDQIEEYATPGSLGDYAPEKYDSPVITFECPVLKDELTLKEIWQENEEALKNLLKSKLL